MLKKMNVVNVMVQVLTGTMMYVIVMEAYLMFVENVAVKVSHVDG